MDWVDQFDVVAGDEDAGVHVLRFRLQTELILQGRIFYTIFKIEQSFFVRVIFQVNRVSCAELKFSIAWALLARRNCITSRKLQVARIVHICVTIARKEFLS